jgi:hypothetical protein
MYLEIENKKTKKGDQKMKIINAKTKTGKAMLMGSSLERSEGNDIYDVYKTSSYEKRNAWKNCVSRCSSENGKNIRITGHSSYAFTVA